jgi:hypothetical protein
VVAGGAERNSESFPSVIVAGRARRNGESSSSVMDAGDAERTCESSSRVMVAGDAERTWESSSNVVVAGDAVVDDGADDVAVSERAEDRAEIGDVSSPVARVDAEEVFVTAWVEKPL